MKVILTVLNQVLWLVELHHYNVHFPISVTVKVTLTVLNGWPVVTVSKLGGSQQLGVDFRLKVSYGLALVLAELAELATLALILVLTLVLALAVVLKPMELPSVFLPPPKSYRS